jgi:hypothetical protein
MLAVLHGQAADASLCGTVVLLMGTHCHNTHTHTHTHRLFCRAWSEVLTAALLLLLLCLQVLELC